MMRLAVQSSRRARRPPRERMTTECWAKSMDAALPKTSVAEHLADTIVALDAGKLPAAVRRTCEDLLVDVAGLCVTVRDADYVKASLAGWDDDGPCTAIGHARTHERGRRRLRQRHRGAWRGFRRHLRGRPGACRRGDRAGGAGGLRAAQSGRPRGAASASRSASRSCAGCRLVAPMQGAQGRLPSDRDLRRHGRGGRRRRGARA